MKGSDWEREASLTIFRNGKISVDQNVEIDGEETENVWLEPVMDEEYNKLK